VIVKVFSAIGLVFLPSLVIGIVKYTDAVYMLPDYAALPTLASVFFSALRNSDDLGVKSGSKLSLSVA